MATILHTVNVHDRDFPSVQLVITIFPLIVIYMSLNVSKIVLQREMVDEDGECAVSAYTSTREDITMDCITGMRT